MNSLREWAENRWVREHAAGIEELRGLAAVVERNLKDADVEDLSLDARVNLLYQACRTLCDMALRGSGFRASPGRHHEYLLRSLTLTLGQDWQATVAILNAARATRARNDYESVGAGTLANLTELREVVITLRPAVVAFLRERGFDVS